MCLEQLFTYLDSVRSVCHPPMSLIKWTFLQAKGSRFLLCQKFTTRVNEKISISWKTMNPEKKICSKIIHLSEQSSCRKKIIYTSKTNLESLNENVETNTATPETMTRWQKHCGRTRISTKTIYWNPYGMNQKGKILFVLIADPRPIDSYVRERVK